MSDKSNRAWSVMVSKRGQTAMMAVNGEENFADAQSAIRYAQAAVREHGWSKAVIQELEPVGDHAYTLCATATLTAPKKRPRTPATGGSKT